MTRLSVNLNKIATLRNARGGEIPSVLKAAETCIAAGAHGITVHPRQDERHITRQDVRELTELLKKHPSIEFNIEGYPDERYVEIVEQAMPDQTTLVPDAPDQLTSDHGWDLSTDIDWLKETIERLKKSGCRVSVFLDPVPEAVDCAKAHGADRIELYTEEYARKYPTPERDAVYARFQAAARRADEIGLGLNAGHDLSLDNLAHFRSGIPYLMEVSIGHALIADALYMGMENAVKAYLGCLRSLRPSH